MADLERELMILRPSVHNAHKNISLVQAELAKTKDRLAAAEKLADKAETHAIVLSHVLGSLIKRLARDSAEPHAFKAELFESIKKMITNDRAVKREADADDVETAMKRVMATAGVTD